MKLTPFLPAFTALAMRTRNSFVRHGAVLLASFLLVSSPSQASTLIIDITDSNYIRSGQPNTVQGAGSAQSLLIGDVTGSNDDLRAILAVPLTDGSLAGATITSATLHLTVSALDGTSANAVETLQLFQLTQSFVETQATWNDRSTGAAWTTAGGTFGALPLATLTGNPATVALGDSFDFASSELATLTQTSLGSTMYFLVKLENEDNLLRSIFRFGADDNTTLAYRPQFVIEYVPEPSTYAMLLLGGTCLTYRRRRCIRQD